VPGLRRGSVPRRCARQGRRPLSRRAQNRREDSPWDPKRLRRGDTSLDLALVEAEFSRLWARWERAVEELGGAVPASQLRAVLLIDDTGAVSPGRLALGLGLSASSASSLSDRMETTGLLSYGAGVAADGQSGITLALTAAGQALAAWIRDRRPEVPWQLRFAQPVCPRMGLQQAHGSPA
jgi:DNA-binding MarR family transcriptional regulator